MRFLDAIIRWEATPLQLQKRGAWQSSKRRSCGESAGSHRLERFKASTRYGRMQAPNPTETLGQADLCKVRGRSSGRRQKKPAALRYEGKRRCNAGNAAR